MKISRLRMHRGPLSIAPQQAACYARCLISSLLLGHTLTTPSRKKHVEGRVPHESVLRGFAWGISGETPEEWIDEMCATLLRYKRRHFCTVPHYILTLSEGEKFGPNYKLCVTTLLQALCYSTRHHAIAILHAGAASSGNEHIHLVTCRIDPGSLQLIQEAEGWYRRAMAQTATLLESQCGFAPAPAAPYRFDAAAGKVVRARAVDSKIKLKAESRLMEDNTGKKSPERLAKESAAQAMDIFKKGLAQGRLLNWEALHIVCGMVGLLFHLDGKVALLSPDGQTWFKASQIMKDLGMKHLPGRIQKPYIHTTEKAFDLFNRAMERRK